LPPWTRPRGVREQNNDFQADHAHPAPVQGSDSGSAQGEATGETEVKKQTPP